MLYTISAAGARDQITESSDSAGAGAGGVLGNGHATTAAASGDVQYVTGRDGTDDSGTLSGPRSLASFRHSRFASVSQVER